MRAIRRSLGALALGGAAAFALTVPGHAEGPRAASTFRSGVFAQVNSLAGSAILSMSDMKPGDSVTGVVGIANDGDLAGAFTLSSETESSQPGLGGGDLRSILQLTVTDLTSGATVYSGSLAGLVSRPVGVFAAGDAHSYRFTVTLPDRGGAESAVAGASASVRYSWTASDPSTATDATAPGATDTDAGSGGGSTGSPTAATPPTGTTTLRPPRDVTPPRLGLSGRPRQWLRRAHLTARCDEECILVAVARVRGVRGVHTLRMVRPAKTVKAGRRIRLTLRPGRRATILIARALRAHKRVRIVVRVTAEDLADNASRGSWSVRLRHPRARR